MLYGSVLVLIVLITVLVLLGVKRSREIESKILSVLLRYGEMYGLQIADAIEQDFGTRPGWGVLYPGLRRLERQGIVTARWGDEQPQVRGKARRKYYYRTTGKRIGLKNRKAAVLNLAFSQPKSLSLSTLLEDDRLKKAQEIAVKQSLEVIKQRLD